MDCRVPKTEREWCAVREIEELRRKVGELERWKAEMLAVYKALDAQAIGEELMLPLGTDVFPCILPAIKLLKARSFASVALKNL